MTELNEPLNIDAPLFFLGHTSEGNVVRFHKNFPNLKMNKVIEVINSGDNVDLRKLIEIMNEIKLISSIWMGPAYVFPENFNKKSNAVKITIKNKDLL
ncbi:hypothetical protein [Metabacillus sp. cB07]|uniref:hypothetical protein n=1 Tax=Metabacillus sp. cB07 TaxID=2806989 RepID=UPI00193A1478|nr:hypothetical protein [Metabacillus sp. cB07]